MVSKSFSLRVVKADGTDLCVLPDKAGLSISTVKSQVGSIQFDYPIGGKNQNQLAGGVEVRVLWNQAERKSCRFILEDFDGDDAQPDEEATKTQWTGRSYDSVLDMGIVYPMGFASGAYFTSPADPSPTFTAATAGAIMVALGGAARTRGCFPNLDMTTFNAVHDSNGVAWTRNISKAYTPGMTVLEVLADLVNLGLCEYDTAGRQLRLYEPTAYGVDRSLDGAGQISLFRGRDLTSSPNQGSTRDVRTAALVQGANHYVDYVDAAAVGVSGRREAFVNVSQVDEEASLRYVGLIDVAGAKNPTVEKSHNLNLENPASKVPWTNYDIGDWVLSDVTGVMQKHRVVQLAAELDDSNIKSASVVFDTLIDQGNVWIQRQIDALANGTSLPGAVTSDPGEDFGTPNPISGLAVAAGGNIAYLDNRGNNIASLTVSWTDPTLNTDGSAISNLYGVQVQWKYHADTNWQSGILALPGVQLASFTPLKVGASVDVRAIAVETNGHFSTPVSLTVTTATDSTPPPKASTPTVDVTTFPLNLRIGWDGLDSGGNAMPADFGRCEVHVSTVSGFTPTAATLKDTFYTASPSISDVAGAPGTPYFVRLLAFDTNNNPLVANWATFMSAQSTGTPRVTADGEMGSLTITKLLVGTLSVDMTVSARIKTADTGNRVEMSSAGLLGFNTSGVQTFKLDSTNGVLTINVTSASTITGGTIQTASGASNGGTVQAVVITSASQDRITFYSGAGSAEVTAGYIQNFISGGVGGMSFVGPQMFSGVAAPFITLGGYTPAGGGSAQVAIRLGTPTVSWAGGVNFFCNAFLDLTNTDGSTYVQSSTGTGVGDKIGLWGTTFGIGIAASTISLYCGASGHVSVLDGSPSAPRSSGSTFRPILASAFTVSSRRDSKTNIKTMPVGEGLALIEKLRPVTARSHNDGNLPESMRDRYFLVAEEVAEVSHRLSGHGASEDWFNRHGHKEKQPRMKPSDLTLQGNDLAAFVAVLTAGLKDLKAIVDEQGQQLSMLTNSNSGR